MKTKTEGKHEGKNENAVTRDGAAKQREVNRSVCRTPPPRRTATSREAAYFCLDLRAPAAALERPAATFDAFSADLDEPALDFVDCPL